MAHLIGGKRLQWEAAGMEEAADAVVHPIFEKIASIIRVNQISDFFGTTIRNLCQTYVNNLFNLVKPKISFEIFLQRHSGVKNYK
jgi:hypothetical protein